MELHHFGIVVDKLEEAIPIFEVWMGAKRVGGVVEDEYQRARVQLFLMGDGSVLEVIEPLPGSIGDPHRPGEFHLCFTVPDLDAEMQRLHEFGAVVSHPIVPATPFGKQRLGFIATNSGQLLELLEEKAPVV
ncbi:MAG: VOC family protein [Armatimonadota bacterium]